MKKTRIFFLALLVLGIVLLLGARGCGAWKQARAEAKTKEHAEKAREEAIAPAPSPAVIKVGKVPTPLTYGADGCTEYRVEVWDFYWYLEGGNAIVYPPEGAPSFLDKPGKKVETAFKPGWWKWCRAEPGATGIVLWQ